MPVFLQIPDNPNCRSMDGQVFSCRTAPRIVTYVGMERGGWIRWCSITGLDAPGTPVPATACLIEDSGDGACYLVVGGEWGLRLKSVDDHSPWALDSSGQWGEPYLLMGGDGSYLRFEGDPPPVRT